MNASHNAGRKEMKREILLLVKRKIKEYTEDAEIVDALSDLRKEIEEW